MKLSISLTLAALAAAVSGAPLDHHQDEPKLEVKLERTGNSQVKIHVTNVSKRDLSLVNEGTILDTDDAPQLSVYQGINKVKFRGIHKRLMEDGDYSNQVTHIKAGKTIHVDADAAKLHDLTEGGHFAVMGHGHIPYLGKNGKMAGSVAYQTAPMSMHVDGKKAEASAKHYKIKRADLDHSCAGSRGQITRQALSNCASMANAAAEAAASGSASQFATWFGDSSNSTRGQVYRRMKAVARECERTGGGVLDYYCAGDPFGSCKPNIIAYTVSAYDYTVNCDPYYQIATLTPSCTGQDKSSSELHEFTHAAKVFSPGTDDITYNVAQIESLASNQALMNAANFEHYATAVRLGCH